MSAYLFNTAGFMIAEAGDKVTCTAQRTFFLDREIPDPMSEMARALAGPG